MVVPSFPALFANSSREGLGYITPIFCAKLLDVVCKSIIFILAPRTFDHGWVQNFLPPVQALDIGPLVKEGGDSLPVSSPILLDELCKFVVFLRIPVSFRVLWILRVLILLTV